MIETMETVMKAGANLLVAGSYVFNGDLASNVNILQKECSILKKRLNETYHETCSHCKLGAISIQILPSIF